jgi:UDP-N-acetylglucosamine diphosphorylase/glucosamine-1-phosphate N-acetyltransferase
MANTSLILFDDNRENLKPLSFTRPVADLRIGILTIKEKWERMLDLDGSYHSALYLATQFPANFGAINILVNASVLPTKELCAYISKELPINTLLVKNGVPIALKTSQDVAEQFLVGKQAPQVVSETDLNFIQICYPWDIFKQNGAALIADFNLLTQGRTSQVLSSSNTLIGDASKIFLEEGAWVECSTLNTENGPIYIGKNATVMEGANIRGGFALCESSTLKMGAKIYGPTTIGPHSKVGGEVNNSVIIGYSNKGHDGFLGNSVIGEWCNLGADTNNSNLKNNYGEVRMWNYKQKAFTPIGLQFCGLIMGDHSKTAINTMFNTGTVVGVFSNVFGSGFPRKFIPSFSWGSQKGYMVYKMNKALETAQRVMERRNKELTIAEKVILEHIFEETKCSRNY